MHEAVEVREMSHKPHRALSPGHGVPAAYDPFFLRYAIAMAKNAQHEAVRKVYQMFVDQEHQRRALRPDSGGPLRQRRKTQPN